MEEKVGFIEKYIEFLKSGCNQEVLDILKLVDVDLTTDAPFEKAFGFIKECLEKLKKIVSEEGESNE